MTRCEVKDSYLLIEDEELSIREKIPFSPRSLPEDLSLPNPFLITEKNETGMVLKAFYQVEGRKEGQAKLFYPSGALLAEMYYEKDHLHGPSRFFTEHGLVLSFSPFCHGLQHGKILHYYRSGRLYSVQRFVRGKRQGPEEYFYEDGTRKSLLPYQDDRLHGTVELSFPSGSIKRKCHFIHGIKEGLDSIYNEEKQLLEEDVYQNGIPLKKGH